MHNVWKFNSVDITIINKHTVALTGLLSLPYHTYLLQDQYNSVFINIIQSLIITGLQDQHKVIDQESDKVKVKRAALKDCQQTLADSRQEAGRPDNVDHMSLEQLQEEKVSVQKVLLEFEKEHGRPV